MVQYLKWYFISLAAVSVVAGIATAFYVDPNPAKRSEMQWKIANKEASFGQIIFTAIFYSFISVKRLPVIIISAIIAVIINFI